MTKILVITHDEKLAQTLRVTLTYNRCVVELASTFKSAWNYLGQISFDVLIVDSYLEDGRGIDFCHSLSRMQNHAAVLLMSERIQTKSARKKELQKGLEVLVKPFKFTELQSLINKQLDQKYGSIVLP